MKVILMEGVLLTPPTYFTLSHALAMPELDRRVLTLVTHITGPTVMVPINEAIPHALGSPLLLRVTTQTRGMRRMRRAITTWNSDVVHQHQATWSLPAVGAARETGVPPVVTLHGGNAYPRLGRGAGAAWDAHSRMSAFEGASRLLVVSRYLTDVALGTGADPERPSAHYQDVDTHWWTSASNTAKSRGEPVVLFVGALSRLKGVDDLARVSASLVGHRPRRLVLVGDGPLAPVLRAHAPVHMTFTDQLDREGVRDWMRRARVLALPTKPTQGRQEAAGFVLLEAQTCGAPVIAYHVGETPEMIAPGASILLDERSPDALTCSINEALAWSEDGREDCGVARRAWVTRERSLRGSADQLRAIYADVTR